VACHNQKGSGGGGDNSHNVDLLTVVDSKEGDVATPDRTLLDRLHPGFKTANSVTLHRSSLAKDYTAYHAGLMRTDGPSIRTIEIPVSNREFLQVEAGVQPITVRRTTQETHSAIEVGNYLLQPSQRSTPALWGAGLIDKISD